MPNPQPVESPVPERAPSEGHSLVFALAVTGLFVAVAGFSTFHHEMWRDELDSWLVARDSPSPLSLLWNIRYGGHPALWYLLLWPLTRLTHDPAAMQLLNLAASAGTVFLVASFLPAPRWVRVLAPLGYFLVYEYGSIARNYSLGVLAMAAFCAAFPRRRQAPIVVGVLLALAAHTVLHATVLALAATLVLAGEAIAVDPGPGRRAGLWTGIGVSAAAIALAAWQMMPPPDAAYAPSWRLHLDPLRARAILSHVVDAYVAIPRPGPGFWNTGLLASQPPYADLAPAAALVLVSWFALGLSRRPQALAFYLAGTLGLLAFFYVKFDGFMRHHGFLFVCLGASLWLARTLPVTLEWRLARWAERSFGVLVPALLAAHLAGAGIAVAGDYELQFSAAKRTADLMRSAGVDRLPVLGDQDFAAMAVVGYLDKDRAYYPAGRRFGSNIVWDERRLAPYDLWPEAVRLQQSLHSPVAVIQNSTSLARFPIPWSLGRLDMVGCRQSDVVENESFCVVVLGMP